MKDRDFLLWLSDRLEKVLDEEPYMEHMHKFRAIIKAYPADKTTPNIGLSNNTNQLREELESLGV